MRRTFDPGNRLAAASSIYFIPTFLLPSLHLTSSEYNLIDSKKSLITLQAHQIETNVFFFVRSTVHPSPPGYAARRHPSHISQPPLSCHPIDQNPDREIRHCHGTKHRPKPFAVSFRIANILLFLEDRIGFWKLVYVRYIVLSVR